MVADLTDDFEVDSKFDLVICLDVLSWIPMTLQEKAINNLIGLCNRSLIISIENDRINGVDKFLHQYIKSFGYYLNIYSSKELCLLNSNSTYFVFEKI
jgi:chemotaxis methyl-accepting protein methylase